MHWKSPAKRTAAIMEANMHILDSVDAYTSGKETVRKTLKGTNTFDSALDAASSVLKFVPGARLRTDEMIDRINRKHDPQDQIDKNSFTKAYGGNVDRNSIRTWNELERIKNLPAEPEKVAQAPMMSV